MYRIAPIPDHTIRRIGSVSRTALHLIPRASVRCLARIVHAFGIFICNGAYRFPQGVGVKNPANSNIYEVNARSVLDAYAGYVEGDPEDLLLVLASTAVSNETQSALTRTAERLGYGNAVAWLNIAGDDMPLGARELFTVVEGLDPLALVALDDHSVALLAEAYRCPVATDSLNRVFGRPLVAFSHFATLLESDERKQRAWALLKHLDQPLHAR